MRRRVLPRPWTDAARQVLLFAVAYGCYEVVRGVVNHGDAARATWNAVKVIDLERRLHVFVEPAIQGWALHDRALMALADVAYVNAHGVVTAAALVFIYLRRNDSFCVVRNMFVVAMALALVGYVLFPTAPPRLMPQWGFVDAVRRFTGVDAEHGAPGVLLNPYAAIPSMHVCFAALTGFSMSRLVRRRAARAAWLLYPVAIVFVVIVTGNHYLTDIVLGAAVAAVSGLLSGALLARTRPDMRAFGQATA